MNLLVTAAEAVAGADDPPARFRAALSTDGIDTWPFDTARVRLLHGEELHRRGSITEARAELFAHGRPCPTSTPRHGSPAPPMRCAPPACPNPVTRPAPSASAS
jgi:hypothetical protein